MALSNQLYFDLSADVDSPAFKEGVDQLAEQIVATATQRHTNVPEIDTKPEVDDRQPLPEVAKGSSDMVSEGVPPAPRSRWWCCVAGAPTMGNG